MHIYEKRLQTIQQLVDDIFARPGRSMSVYHSLMDQCSQLSFEIDSSYAQEKLTNIRIEAKMVASGRYESGMNKDQIRQNLNADVYTLDAEIKRHS